VALISTFILWVQRKDHITLKNCWQGQVWAQKTRPKNKFPGRPSRLRMAVGFFKPLTHNRKIRREHG